MTCDYPTSVIGLPKSALTDEQIERTHHVSIAALCEAGWPCESQVKNGKRGVRFLVAKPPADVLLRARRLALLAAGVEVDA